MDYGDESEDEEEHSFHPSAWRSAMIGEEVGDDEQFGAYAEGDVDDDEPDEIGADAELDVAEHRPGVTEGPIPGSSLREALLKARRDSQARQAELIQQPARSEAYTALRMEEEAAYRHHIVATLKSLVWDPIHSSHMSRWAEESNQDEEKLVQPSSSGEMISPFHSASNAPFFQPLAEIASMAARQNVRAFIMRRRILNAAMNIGVYDVARGYLQSISSTDGSDATLELIKMVPQSPPPEAADERKVNPLAQLDGGRVGSEGAPRITNQQQRPPSHDTISASQSARPPQVTALRSTNISAILSELQHTLNEFNYFVMPDATKWSEREEVCVSEMIRSAEGLERFVIAKDFLLWRSMEDTLSAVRQNWIRSEQPPQPPAEAEDEMRALNERLEQVQMACATTKETVEKLQVDLAERKREFEAHVTRRKESEVLLGAKELNDVRGQAQAVRTATASIRRRKQQTIDEAIAREVHQQQQYGGRVIEQSDRILALKRRIATLDEVQQSMGLLKLSDGHLGGVTDGTVVCDTRHLFRTPAAALRRETPNSIAAQDLPSPVQWETPARSPATQ